MFGASAAVTLLTDIGAKSSPTLQRPVAPLSPSEVVDLRFPADWIDTTPPAAETVVAQAGPPEVLLDPKPTYQLASATVEPYQLASATPEPVPAPRQKPVQAAPHTAPAPVAKAKPPAPRIPQGRPGAVFNDAQLASIKKRLQLNPWQERDWPAVEQALRDLSYAPGQAKKSGTRTAALTHASGTIDPDSPEVQRLKSAAVPLVMSFSSEQKGEVRQMIHLIGLDQLANMI